MEPRSGAAGRDRSGTKLNPSCRTGSHGSPRGSPEVTGPCPPPTRRIARVAGISGAPPRRSAPTAKQRLDTRHRFAIPVRARAWLRASQRSTIRRSSRFRGNVSRRELPGRLPRGSRPARAPWQDQVECSTPPRQVRSGPRAARCSTATGGGAPGLGTGSRSPTRARVPATTRGSGIGTRASPRSRGGASARSGPDSNWSRCWARPTTTGSSATRSSGTRRCRARAATPTTSSRRTRT